MNWTHIIWREKIYDSQTRGGSSLGTEETRQGRLVFIILII